MDCQGYNPSPFAVHGIANAIAISNTYAVLSDGTLRHEFGNGVGEATWQPETVAGVTNATAVTVGYEHECVLLKDGAVQCWGDNSIGQLGNGSAGGSSAPVTVSGF